MSDTLLTMALMIMSTIPFVIYRICWLRENVAFRTQKRERVSGRFTGAMTDTLHLRDGSTKGDEFLLPLVMLLNIVFVPLLLILSYMQSFVTL